MISYYFQKEACAMTPVLSPMRKEDGKMSSECWKINSPIPILRRCINARAKPANSINKGEIPIPASEKQLLPEWTGSFAYMGKEV